MKILAGFVLGVLAVPIVFVVAALLGLLPFAAMQGPPAAEATLARAALKASLSRAAAGLSSPIAASDENLARGVKLYRDGCAGCHGVPGHKSTWGTKSFYPRVPQITELEPPISAPLAFVAIDHGIRYSGMAGNEGLMPSEDIWRIALMLSRVGSLPAPLDSALAAP